MRWKRYPLVYFVPVNNTIIIPDPHTSHELAMYMSLYDSSRAPVDFMVKPSAADVLSPLLPAHRIRQAALSK